MDSLYFLTLWFRRIAWAVLGAAVVPNAWGAPATAADYPRRTVHLVVPFSAGGPTDIVARVLAGKLQARLGQPVVIDNKPGGATLVAAQHVAKAPGDGYTLLLASSTTFSMLPALRPMLAVAAPDTWTPIGLVAQIPVLLSTRAELGIESVADLVARARARPGALTYGTTGPGTAPHVVGTLIATGLRVELTPVPYRGSAQILLDVASGRLDLSIDSVGTVRPLVETGRLRPLAISATERSAQYPQVPTFAELDIPIGPNAFWFGLAAPRGTPHAVVARLQAALHAVLLDPAVEQAFALQSIEILHGNAQAFSEQVRNEVALYGRLVREGRIKAD